MQKVNMAIGRFQPFTKGHLQMVRDGFTKNGLPAVVCMISNKKPDSRHPFSDKLIEKELELVKKNNPELIADIVLVQNADIVKSGQELADRGYQAQLWLCGDDRVDAYKKQAENPKYRSQGGYPDSFTVYTGTGRVEGVSGTAARGAIRNGDLQAYKKVMPKGTDKLFDDFVDEMSGVKESSRSLSEYLTEAVSHGRKSVKYSSVFDENCLTADGLMHFIKELGCEEIPAPSNKRLVYSKIKKYLGTNSWMTVDRTSDGRNLVYMTSENEPEKILGFELKYGEVVYAETIDLSDNQVKYTEGYGLFFKSAIIGMVNRYTDQT